MLVLVQMQAMKEDPPLDFKCKDKFLVQSVAITAERELLTANELVRTNYGPKLTFFSTHVKSIKLLALHTNAYYCYIFGL